MESSCLGEQVTVGKDAAIRMKLEPNSNIASTITHHYSNVTIRQPIKYIGLPLNSQHKKNTLVMQLFHTTVMHVHVYINTDMHGHT